MAGFSRVIGSINKWVGNIITPLSFIILVMIVVEVTLRYLFNKPTAWAMPMSQLLFGTVSILGGGWVLLHDEHVSMDLISRRFSPRRKALVDLVLSVFFFFFCGIMLWKGAQYGWDSLMKGETLSGTFRPIVYPIKLLIPLAALLIILQGVVKFARDLSVVRAKKDIAEE